MRKDFAVLAVALIFLRGALPAMPSSTESSVQRTGLSVSAAVGLPDWELGSAEAIRSGKATLIRRASGDVLDIDFLSKDMPSGRRTGVKPAVFNGDYFLVSNFETQPPHSLGGGFGAFQGAPSTAQLDILSGPDGQGSMILTAKKEQDGWCGAWIHLIETNGEPLTREFLNGEIFSHLVFWVRGTAAGPEANVKLADAAWYKKEDSVAIGPIASFLPSKKIESSWQLASIPLNALPSGLERRSLAVFVIELKSPGSYRLEVKGLGLANNPGALPAEPPKTRSASKAAWVWNTEQTMSSRTEQNALLTYLAGEGVNLVYLNLPFKFGGFAFDETEMGGLIMLLQQKGIRTEALFGDKDLALSRNHAFVKNAVKDIIAYNSRVAASARFSGIHLDIEPHLLRGFNGPKRGEILGNFLRVMADASALARSGRLEFGADMPSWYDAVNDFSGEVLTAALDGKTKPLFEHIIDLCDHVALKDFFTSASGVNGTVGQAVGELAYAAKTGKKVFIGLQAGPVEDRRVFSFRGAPAPDPFAFPNAPFFACVSGTGADLTLAILEPAAAADFQAKGGGAGKVELWWPVYAAPEIPGAAVTFAGLGGEALKQTSALTAGELSVYPSFAGIAVHDFAGHRQLLAVQR